MGNEYTADYIKSIDIRGVKPWLDSFEFPHRRLSGGQDDDMAPATIFQNRHLEIGAKEVQANYWTFYFLLFLAFLSILKTYASLKLAGDMHSLASTREWLQQTYCN